MILLWQTRRAWYSASNDYTGGTELMTALRTAGTKVPPPSPRPRSHSAVLLLQQHACEIIYLGMDGDHGESHGLAWSLYWISRARGLAWGEESWFCASGWRVTASMNWMRQTLSFSLPRSLLSFNENGSSLHTHLTKLVIWTCTPLRCVLFLRTYTSLLSHSCDRFI